LGLYDGFEKGVPEHVNTLSDASGSEDGSNEAALVKPAGV
jgi:hypothetical protein